LRLRSDRGAPSGALLRSGHRHGEVFSGKQGGRPGAVSWGGHSHRPRPAEPHGPRRCGGPEHSV